MGSIFIQFPKGKKKALTLSYDDGVEQDIRLIEIMKQHGLKGIMRKRVRYTRRVRCTEG